MKKIYMSIIFFVKNDSQKRNISRLAVVFLANIQESNKDINIFNAMLQRI
jgi:hypothetical protein